MNNIAIIEFGFGVGYEEFSRSWRVLSTSALDLQNSSYPIMPYSIIAKSFSVSRGEASTVKAILPFGFQNIKSILTQLKCL